MPFEDFWDNFCQQRNLLKPVHPPQPELLMSTSSFVWKLRFQWTLHIWCAGKKDFNVSLIKTVYKKKKAFLKQIVLSLFLTFNNLLNNENMYRSPFGGKVSAVILGGTCAPRGTEIFQSLI